MYLIGTYLSLNILIDVFVTVFFWHAVLLALINSSVHNFTIRALAPVTTLKYLGNRIWSVLFNLRIIVTRHFLPYPLTLDPPPLQTGART